MKQDIDIAHLRTFLAVVEHKSMTQAAQLRNLTQSAVSQQIKRLEITLDCELLQRSAAGVFLTPQGNRLLARASELVRKNDTTVAEIAGIEQTTEIQLGVPQDIVSSLLPNALKSFHQKWPDVHVTLVSASSQQLSEMFSNGQVDIALTTDSKIVSGAELLFKKRLIWIGAINGQSQNKRPLPVAVAQESCPFRQAATKVLASSGIPWRPVTQVGSLEPVFATLMADMAVAPFLSGTLPTGTQEIDNTLPSLPEFCLHLRMPKTPRTVAEKALCSEISDSLREQPVS